MKPLPVITMFTTISSISTTSNLTPPPLGNLTIEGDDICEYLGDTYLVTRLNYKNWQTRPK